MKHKPRPVLPALCLGLLLLPGARPMHDGWPHGDWPDGPWIELPPGYVYEPPTADDIRAMADLDGDPTVTTDAERRMLATLGQVLLGSPLNAQ